MRDRVDPASPGRRRPRRHLAALLVVAGLALAAAPAASAADSIYLVELRGRLDLVRFARLDVHGKRHHDRSDARQPVRGCDRRRGRAGLLGEQRREQDLLRQPEWQRRRRSGDDRGNGGRTRRGCRSTRPPGGSTGRTTAMNKISFANLNGSGGGDLVTTGATVSSPTGAAVDPAAGRIYWANLGASGKISYDQPQWLVLRCGRDHDGGDDEWAGRGGDRPGRRADLLGEPHRQQDLVCQPEQQRRRATW